MEKIRVLVVDDQSLIRRLLTEILNRAPNIEVVGEAADPYIARDEIKRLNPHVITLDVEMPNMNGLAFLKNLMNLRPMPVVMVSTLTEKGAPVSLEALELGAVDYVAKPKEQDSGGLKLFAQELTQKVQMAAKANVRSISKALKPAAKSSIPAFKGKSGLIVTIGASTGGTEAIREVISVLPQDFPPVVIAQHIPKAFSRSFAKRLDSFSKVSVLEAETGLFLKKGHVYLAPGDLHLSLKRTTTGFQCVLRDTDPVNRHKPSVDVLFDSVSEQVGKKAIAVLLTGMGKDGAKGLLKLRDRGAFTIAQDEATSVVWGMPGAAVELDAAREILPLHSIADRITALTSANKSITKAS